MNNHSKANGRSHLSRNAQRDARRALIGELVRREKIGTQKELIAALREHGVMVGQASISRDTTALGLVKINGRYRLANPEPIASDPDLPFRLWVRSVATAGENLLVVGCELGTAPRVAIALDHMKLSAVVGTLSGDDTVFVAVSPSGAIEGIKGLLLERMTPQVRRG